MPCFNGIFPFDNSSAPVQPAGKLTGATVNQLKSRQSGSSEREMKGRRLKIGPRRIAGDARLQ
jgi:hypothetical protein